MHIVCCRRIVVFVCNSKSKHTQPTQFARQDDLTNSLAHAPQTRALTRHFSEAHRHSSSDEDEEDEQPSSSSNSATTAVAKKLARAPTPRRDHRVAVSQFMPTSRRLVQFSEGKSAAEEASIVYIDGAFDVFHPGHVEILKVGALCRPVHVPLCVRWHRIGCCMATAFATYRPVKHLDSLECCLHHPT